MTDPLVSAAEAMAIGACLDGGEIGFAWSLPFIGLLLSIAAVPLLAPYFWERQFGKVAALWTFALLLPCAVVFGIADDRSAGLAYFPPRLSALHHPSVHPVRGRRRHQGERQSRRHAGYQFGTAYLRN